MLELIIHNHVQPLTLIFCLGLVLGFKFFYNLNKILTKTLALLYMEGGDGVGDLCQILESLAELSLTSFTGNLGDPDCTAMAYDDREHEEEITDYLALGADVFLAANPLELDPEGHAPLLRLSCDSRTYYVHLCLFWNDRLFSRTGS